MTIQPHAFISVVVVVVVFWRRLRNKHKALAMLEMKHLFCLRTGSLSADGQSAQSVAWYRDAVLYQ